LFLLASPLDGDLRHGYKIMWSRRGRNVLTHRGPQPPRAPKGARKRGTAPGTELSWPRRASSR
jgi:hypothetical protein